MATKEAPENFICPHCQKGIEAAEIVAAAASLMGKKGVKKGITSEKKAKSSAENGKKGGRPKKTTVPPESTI